MDVDILSDLIIQRVYCISSFHTETRASSKRTDRPTWGIMLKYEGATRYECEGKTYLSDKNHIVVLPRGSSYSWCCTEAGHCLTVEFECDAVCSRIFSFSVKNDEFYLNILKKMELGRTLKKPGHRLEERRDLYALLCALFKSAEDKYVPAKTEAKIAPAIEYIAQHYNTLIANDTLAALCGLSTVYFRKLFVACTGVSPIRYVHTLRMRKAKDMLRGDLATVGEIAYSVGYANVYAFSKMFKQYVGSSPSAYAAENRRT